MRQDYCVEIFADGSYGSGYALTETAVLTALHVVVDKRTGNLFQNLRVRLLRDYRNGETDKHPARVIWQDAERDLALLARNNNQRWHDITLCDFGVIKGYDRHRADAAGFPRFRAQGDIRDLFPATGSVWQSPKTGDTYFALPHDRTNDPAQWAGFSGSAVFVSDLLAGIVTDVETALEGSLVVTGLTEVMLADQHFREALQLTGPVDWSTIGDQAQEGVLHRPRFADKLTAATEDEMRQLSRLYGLCMSRVTPNATQPLDLAAFPVDLKVKRTAWIRLRGAQGAGKTVFLSALYNVLGSDLIDPRFRRTPVFVDAAILRSKNDTHAATKQLVDEVEAKFEVGSPVLIVDGLSARDRGVSASLCRQLHDRVDFRRTEAAIWSVSEDFEASFDAIFADIRGWPETDPSDMLMESKGSQDAMFEEFLRAFAVVHDRAFSGRASPPDAKRLQAFVDRANDFAATGDVDPHLLSLVYRSLDWPKYQYARPIAPFLELYCSDRLHGDKFDSIYDLQADDVLRNAAWLAYRTTVAGFYSEPGKIPARLRIQPPEQGSAAQGLLDEHDNIVEFLTAWYIADRLWYLNAEHATLIAFVNDLVVDYDFTQLTNGYVRALIMDDMATTQSVLRSLQNLVALLGKRQERLPLSENFIAYLLGRFPFDLVNPSPRAVLTQLEAPVRLGLQAESATARRFARTGARTIAVSQMHLGQADKGDTFLRSLLLDSELAAIDRGYHRLYYRDCVGYRDRVPDCYLDSPNETWRRSFQHLAARIRQALPELADPSTAVAVNGTATLGQETQHKIVTLLLFVQSRFGVTSDHETEHRAFAKQVTALALRRAGWPDEVLAFIEMMNQDLQEADAGVWRFIIDLYQLKLELRRGWLLRGMDGAAVRDRVESVAEHSFMAALLASILLPEQVAGLANYRKDDVVNLLLAHDIAEAFTGDIVTYGLSEQQRNAAWDLEERTHRYMRWKSTYGGAPGAPRLADLCTQFARGRTAGAASGSVVVAREMDKLENLFQVYVYRASRPDRLTEPQLEEFVRNLRKDVTVLGDTYDRFVAWADQRRDGLLGTRRPFYDPTLLDQAAPRKPGP